MRLIGNILWFIFGGGISALMWFFAAVIMAISIIGIPWARACLIIGQYTLIPFGSRLVERQYVTGHHDVGTGPLGFLGNIIWFVFGGWYLVLTHFLFGCLWCITIIGIPFGIAHFRLARASLALIGKTVVAADTYI